MPFFITRKDVRSMYGIGNRLFNYSQLYSNSLFGGQKQGSYSSGGIFGAGQSNAWNSWNNMVPNYAQINYSLLGKYLSNNYSDIQDKLGSLSNSESASKTFYSEFNSTFSGLKTAASALKSFSDTSVFRPTGYGSSNSSVASVTKDTAAVTAPINLEVKQTAASQSYASSAINSKGNTLNGKNTLTLTDGDGKKTAFNFNFNPAKDNKDHLNQIAEAINGKQMGITASVSETDGKSTLVFSSDKTGTKNTFTAEFTGDGASKLGLREDRQARDAKYSVDGGEEQTSQSNSIQLADGKLGVTLKGEGTTQIGRKVSDDSKTVDAVKQFAESYNKALGFLTKNSGKSPALTSLAYSFSSTRFQSGSLSKIGIAVDSSGALSVNESKLTNALKNNRGDVEKALGGASGLATSSYGKAVNAMNNSRNLYPQSPAISYSNYMYGRDKSYINSYMNGLFLSSLI